MWRFASAITKSHPVNASGAKLVGMTREKLIANPGQYLLRAFDPLRKEWVERDADTVSLEDLGILDLRMVVPKIIPVAADSLAPAKP